MIDFSEVVSIEIPEGNVVEISSDGVSLWGAKRINYVSMGDSIAVGHRIDSNWETDYGWDNQYGVDGRTKTTLVSGCYTDIIGKELKSVYGDTRASVTSFARSGDKVSDLMTKLSHSRVQAAIKNADLVTICIGANDVLHYALTNLADYIATADSSVIDGYVSESLAVLNDDTNANSYISLFNRLNEINPDAKYVFTTVYNPYKYLHLVEGSERGSFFFHILNNIPPMLIDVDRNVEYLMEASGLSWLLHDGDLAIYNVAESRWVSLELDIELGQYIKDALLDTPAVKTLFKSINALGTHAEGYIDGNDRFIGLDPILRSKINSYQAVNPNFMLAETKKLFDLFPTRTDTDVDTDYSDLVNVDFSASYEVTEMDWEALWKPDYITLAGYLLDLANKHLSFKLPGSITDITTDPWDYVEFDVAAFASDLVDDIVAKVIEPHVDPHPRHGGHQVMKRSFGNVFGLTKYESNGGLYVPGDVVLHDRTLTAPNAVKVAYKFGGWYTDAELTQVLDPSRADFVDYDSDITLADLVSGNTIISKAAKVTPLYAKWLDPDLIILENLVPAINGIDGFTFSGSSNATRSAEASTTHTKYAAQSLKMSIGSDCAEICANSTGTYPLDASHIYYFRMEGYQEVAYGTAEMYFPIAEPHPFNIPVETAGQWNIYSTVCDRSTFDSGNYKFRLDFNNEKPFADAEIWYDGVMIIDLTAAFGAGSEPTKEWCDANIPYFVGTTTLYEELEYIESTGTQYIDTDFKANQDTRVVLDAYNLTTASGWTFGAWSSAVSKQYAFSCMSDFSFRYGTKNVQLSQVPVGALKVDFNKNTYNLNGETGTLDSQVFSCEYSMYLFAINNKGTVSNGKFTGRVYSCKIYDNGALVRDFIPAKRTADGTIGLYDRVNGEFYTNAGSGEFTTA